MICPNCKNDRFDKDFFGKPLCYHCEYEKKMGLLKKKFCKVCGIVITSNRWAYCSIKCGNKASVIMKREYWTKKIT